jgi:hypothetical protein
MPQAFACVLSTPEPLKALGGANTCTVQVVAPITITWTDASTDLIPRDAPITSLESGAVLVDTSTALWLLVAVKGTNTLRLCLQTDFATLDALTGSGTWAPLYQVILARIDVFQQV